MLSAVSNGIFDLQRLNVIYLFFSFFFFFPYNKWFGGRQMGNSFSCFLVLVGSWLYNNINSSNCMLFNKCIKKGKEPHYKYISPFIRVFMPSQSHTNISWFMLFWNDESPYLPLVDTGKARLSHGSGHISALNKRILSQKVTETDLQAKNAYDC